MAPLDLAALPHDTESMTNSAKPAWDLLLDDGLRRLGMLPEPIILTQSSQAPSADTNGLVHEDADCVIVVERVLPEEEERRYFENLGRGYADDLVGDTNGTPPSRRRRPAFLPCIAAASGA
eukprot:gnl/TRDRNA2_/TRDRNA2_31832_c0_seq1.p1 gnl/TRDRNA2_/TRDRNA2_31832_c0~~gnl/TRDRNA2_/TRDRNA2_31832_c0_seq1.p1  ORF type:complete len:121 (+),score=18.96 gnl/TRDRNA2_/TRDRNA2_31832_c0_seq1:146-508(+)